MSRRWTEERIRRELEAFLPAFDTWPSYPVFRASARRELWEAILARGGPARFAEEYGLPYTPNARRPVDDEIRARLRSALRGSGVVAWPSRAWLQEHVGPDVVAAIDRCGGPGRWAREMGLPFWHRHGHRWTPETIAAALKRLLAGRSTLPCRREFDEAGLGGLYGAIRATEGHRALAARHGLPLQRPGRHRAPRQPA